MMPKTPNQWVDTHFHVFHANQAVTGARYVPSYAAHLSTWQTLAQSVGITRGVWVQPSFLGTDNRLMVDALLAQPDRLRGVAVVTADTPLNTLKNLHASGVRGVRLNLAGVSHDIAAWTRADHIWQALHALGWHLELHTDSGALPSVLAQLPSDIPLVVDHMAKPLQAVASDATVRVLSQRARHTSTHIKLSGAYRLGGLEAATVARMWRDELGVQALLWGSDWPCTNHEHLANYDVLFDALAAWVGVQHLDDVLQHNPVHVYGFG